MEIRIGHRQGAAAPLPCRGKATGRRSSGNGVRGGVTILFTLLFLLLTGCSDEDQPTIADTPQPLSFTISEAPWQQEHVNITRSDASMLEGLKESSLGFGVYSTIFWLTNQKVTWDGTNQRWNYGYTLLWPQEHTEADMLAYAPYSASTIYSNGKISYMADNTTDLLWGEMSRKGYEVSFKFHHALSKLSFGTITNNSGKDLVLKSIKLEGESGTGLYTSGDLSLANGTWSNLSGSSEETINLSPNISIASDAATKTADMKNGASSIERLLIPGPTVKVTLSFTYDGDDLTAAFDVPLTQAVHTTVNVTIKKNFEVVIE